MPQPPTMRKSSNVFWSGWEFRITTGTATGGEVLRRGGEGVMRFDRCLIRKRQRGIAPRHLAAAARAVKRERESWGLFADQVAIETPEERIARMDDTYKKWAQGIRRYEASQWLKARRALRMLPGNIREGILGTWNSSKWLPGEGAYFSTFLRRRLMEIFVTQVSRLVRKGVGGC